MTQQNTEKNRLENLEFLEDLDKPLDPNRKRALGIVLLTSNVDAVIKAVKSVPDCRIIKIKIHDERLWILSTDEISRYKKEGKQ